MDVSLAKKLGWKYKISLNDAYDVRLKSLRIGELKNNEKYYYCNWWCWFCWI